LAEAELIKRQQVLADDAADYDDSESFQSSP